MNTAWPFNTDRFAALPISCWTKALLKPHSLLGIPKRAVFDFQLNALITMDNIWLARNKLVHKGSSPNPQAILKLIKNLVSHHIAAWKSNSDYVDDWSPPPRGFLKANFDVAIRPNFVVAAAILRDHQEEIIAAHSQRLPYMDANQGEARAASLAVQLASSYGFPPLILEGDSLVTILAINSPHIASE